MNTIMFFYCFLAFHLEIISNTNQVCLDDIIFEISLDKKKMKLDDKEQTQLQFSLKNVSLTKLSVSDMTCWSNTNIVLQNEDKIIEENIKVNEYIPCKKNFIPIEKGNILNQNHEFSLNYIFFIEKKGRYKIYCIYRGDIFVNNKIIKNNYIKSNELEFWIE